MNYRTLIVDTNYDNNEEEKYLQFAMEYFFCGVIMLNVIESKNIIDLIKSANIPIVFLNRYIKTLNMDIISMDNYRCGYLATQYLINAGHTRILHLGGPQNSNSCKDRLRGYIECMEDNGLPFEKNDLFYGDLHSQSGIAFAKFILSRRDSVTAVYSANDIMAMSMVETLMENGINVPDNISVVCTDNTPAAISGKVKLTCVSYDCFLMGKAAGKLLLERIGNPNAEKKNIMYYPDLIQRDSVKKI
jgi:DNA-binding LacI/PurR family transcriptional regulator